MRAADPGERPLVAQERVQPPVVAGEDLAQLAPRRARAPPARDGRARPPSAPATRARLRPASSGRPRSARARRRSRSGAGTPASSAPWRPGRDAGSGRRSSGGSRSWSSPCRPSGRGATCRAGRAPANRLPSSSRSGGSNVFSVAMCAGPACSTGAADTSGSSSRTHASTSGSSGMRRTVQRRARLSRRRRRQRSGRRGDEAARCLRLRRQRLVDRLGHLAQRPHRREQHRQDRERHSDRADPDRRAQAEPRGERAAEQRAERHHAPDDEAHHRVHPSLEPLGRDRLPEADLGDVVDRDAHARDRLRGDQERDRIRRPARPRAGAARREPAAPTMIVGPTPKRRERRFASSAPTR